MVLGQADVTLYLSVYLDRISQAVSDDLFSKEVDKQCGQDVRFIWVNRKQFSWYRGGQIRLHRCCR